MLGRLNTFLLIGVGGIAAAYWPGTANGVACAVLAAGALTAAVQAAIVVRLVGRPRFDLALAKLRQVARLGASSYVGHVASLANYRLDVILLGLLADVGTVGVYAIVTKIAEVGRYFSVAVSEFWTPHAARKAASEAWSVSRRISVRLWAITAATMIPVALAGPWLLGLFGPGLRFALPALWLLAAGIVAQGATGPVISYNLATGRPMRNTLAALAALAVTVALDVVLIPILGITGAAAASMASYATFGGILVVTFLLRRELRPPAGAVLAGEG
jgi:O-antigen/teichoic acid export membrane protein